MTLGTQRKGEKKEWNHHLLRNYQHIEVHALTVYLLVSLFPLLGCEVRKLADSISWVLVSWDYIPFSSLLKGLRC